MNSDHHDEGRKTPTVSMRRPLRPEARGRADLPPTAGADAMGSVHNRGSRIHVLFLNNATIHATAVLQHLTGRGIYVTPVGDLAAVENEWRLGVHDLVLVGHGVPMGARLALLRASRRRIHPIPIVMIFDSSAKRDAELALARGATRCIVRDAENDYLPKMIELIELQIMRRPFLTTQDLPADTDDTGTAEVDLRILADELPDEVRELPPVQIVVASGPDVGLTADVTGRACVIGRDPTSQLCLTDETISRFHASIRQVPGGGLEIRDLNSRNGVYVHRKRITTALLTSGDAILLGGNTLVRFRT